MLKIIKKAAILLPVLLLALTPADAFFGSKSSAPQSQYRGALKRSIDSYNKGNFDDAFEGFMDVLVSGTPEEKAIANEYLNKINYSMSAAESSAPEGQANSVIIDGSKLLKEAAQASPVFAVQGGYDDTVQDPAKQKQLMSKKVDQEIGVMKSAALHELNKIPGVTIFMTDERVDALSLDPDKLFDDKIVFKPGAERMLGAVANMLYTVGKANCQVMPYGRKMKAPSIMDMRRAMAVYSYLVNRGISPARLHVDLNLSKDMDIPERFSNLSGIALIMDYTRSPELKQQVILDPDVPPSLSLGVYPPRITATQDEGFIIEFSVVETAAEIANWKFQIAKNDGKKWLTVVQEASGNNAAFHQIFWNGRREFFGELVPPGEYLCVLSANDVDGREKIVRKAVTLISEDLPEPLPTARRTGAVKEKELVLDNTAKATGVSKLAGRKGRKAAKAAAAAAAKKARAKKARKAKKAAAASEESAASADKPMNYTIAFESTSSVISPEGQRKIKQIADSLSSWPGSKVTLTAHMASGESTALGNERLSSITQALIATGHASADRIISAVSDAPAEVPSVDAQMTGAK